jgi:hypothetical protein
MELAASHDMRPAEFWRTTPREFNRFLAGRLKAQRRELALAVTGAYYGAGWAPGRTRKEKLPDLARILRRIMKEPRREQTPDESLRIAEALNRMFGGKDLRPGKT